MVVAGEKLLMRDVRSNSTVGQTMSFHGGDERGAERGPAGTSGQPPRHPSPRREAGRCACSALALAQGARNLTHCLCLQLLQVLQAREVRKKWIAGLCRAGSPNPERFPETSAELSCVPEQPLHQTPLAIPLGFRRWGRRPAPGSARGAMLMPPGAPRACS